MVLTSGHLAELHTHFHIILKRLGALIVIDVHAKEVIRKLKDERIDDINAFEWIS